MFVSLCVFDLDLYILHSLIYHFENNNCTPISFERVRCLEI